VCVAWTNALLALFVRGQLSGVADHAEVIAALGRLAARVLHL
jgi:hypothetical protein